MKTQVKSKIFRNVCIAGVIAGFSLIAAGKTRDSEQISIYMHQARVHSIQAARDLALLQTYSMAGVPWQVHFNRLQLVDDSVNSLVNDYNRLNALRASATPSQVETLNTIQPILQDLHAQVKESLRYLNYHSNEVHMPPFTRLVHVEFANVNTIFASLCNCTKKNNNVLVAYEKDKTAISDCSNKSFVSTP
jgi:hypothetical protein